MNMYSSATKQSKILPLTSLRFFASLYVVLYHTMARVFVHSRDLSTLHGRILDLGYIAVSFFFTLSGYILAVSYLPRQIHKQRFWWARFSRIYPIFLLSLLGDAPQYLFGVAKQVGYHAAFQVVLTKIVGNMLMIQAWLPSMRSVDWPNWSLSVEAFFYLLFPFLIVGAARMKPRPLITAGALSYVAGMAAVTMAMRTHVSLDVLKFNPLFHLHAFLCGTLLGAFRVKTRQTPLYAPAFLCAALACFALTVRYYNDIPSPLIHDGLLVPAFGCLILAFGSGNTAMDRFLSLKWLVVLGEASFALYLIHIPLWHLFYHLRMDQSPIAYPVYLVCAIALSVLSFFYIETPLRRTLNNGNRLITKRLTGEPRRPSSAATEQSPVVFPQSV